MITIKCDKCGKEIELQNGTEINISNISYDYTVTKTQDGTDQGTVIYKGQFCADCENDADNVYKTWIAIAIILIIASFASFVSEKHQIAQTSENTQTEYQQIP